MFDRIRFNRSGILALGALLGAGLIFTPAAAGQTTWYVDDDAPNDPGPGDPGISDPDEDGSAEHPFDAIQEAIYAAADGDEVVVADGTYTGYGNRDMDFAGRAITVRSENGSDNCIIDCQDAGRAFYFHSEENAESVVRGFTMTHGYADHGGAICCYPASPTIRSCTFVDNQAYGAYGSGGAAYCGGDTVIDRCNFLANVADRAGGLCAWGNATVSDCTFSGNTAEFIGAAEVSGGAIISNCTLTQNSADAIGAVGCFGNALVTNCVIRNNEAAEVGGAACCENSAMNVCLVLENTAYDATGGLFCAGEATTANSTVAGNSVWWGGDGGGITCAGNSTISNCVVTYNSANAGGGIFCYWESSPTIVGCTIVSNGAAWGGGIHWSNSSATVSNCILWGNQLQQLQGAGSIAVSYCDIQGGWPAGVGNIAADPLFVDADGPDDDPNTWQDNDYRLLGDSPCVDAGDNDGVPAWVTTDLDGRLRFADRIGTPDTGNGTAPIVDMGAYEYQCTGDLDGDGEIDLADLAELLAHYGTTSNPAYADGDLDQDSDVDLTDLATLLAAYGTTCE